MLSIANHTFIMLDAPSLVEEDYRRYAAEVQLGEWEGVPGGVIEFVKSLGDGKSPAEYSLQTSSLMLKEYIWCAKQSLRPSRGS